MKNKKYEGSVDTTSKMPSITNRLDANDKDISSLAGGAVDIDKTLRDRFVKVRNK